MTQVDNNLIREFLRYCVLDMVNAKITWRRSFESKDEIDWVFQSDHVISAFIIAERQYCKTRYFQH